ncbi:glycosyltransferase [Methanobrevibacter ruminantium]|uniref:glycosyltransferase n=1 Tax=Methanobrevibacter ruminantium TaxID=83816 RepID=UPI002D7E9D05|nr:glycosyltransferase [Methanobrevibacter ruminantium]
MDIEKEAIEKPLVSIIVPVYNTEEYLEECLDCLVNQTLQNIEIICINDASTDNSLEIVNDFSQNDERIKVMNNETNQGPSITRNIGIKAAKGEYIVFFDSDDIIETDAYEKLYNEAKEHAQDMIIYNFKRFDDNGVEWFETLQKNSNIDEYVERTNILEHPELIWNTTSCNKFIKRDLLIKNDLRFLEKRLFEDLLFSTQVQCLTDSIGIYPEVVYKWRFRAKGNKSISQSNENIKNLKDRIFISNEIIALLKENEKYKPLLPHLYKKLLKHDFIIFINQLDIADDEFKETLISEIVPLIETFPMESFDDIGELSKAKYNLLLKEDFENIILIVKYEKSTNQITNAKIKEKNAEIRQLRIKKEEIRKEKNAEIRQLRIKKEEIRARKEEIRKEKNAKIKELKQKNREQREEIKELKSTKGWMKYKKNNLFERGKNKF